MIGFRSAASDEETALKNIYKEARGSDDVMLKATHVCSIVSTVHSRELSCSLVHEAIYPPEQAQLDSSFSLGE